MSIRDLGKEGERLRTSAITDERSSRSFYMHEVRDALVAGGPQPVCFLDRNQRNVVLDEVSDYTPWARAWSETAFRQEANQHVVGEVEEACCISLPHNYCHWHQEALPKVCLMEKSGFSGRYIIADVPLFIESLSLIGIDPARVLPLSAGTMRVARLHVPEQLTIFYGNIYPSALWDARNRCLQADIDRSLSARHLFINRSRQTHRHIIDEDQLLRLLQRFDFEMVYMEKLSLRQQIGLASSASVVIGPHGAGIASCLFMQEHGRVLELFSPAYINSCVLPICRLLNLSYFPIVSKVNPVDTYQYGQNIDADLDLIAFQLERHLA